MLRVQNSQPGACGRGPAVVIPDVLGQACSPADGLAVRDQGQAKVQPPQQGLSNGRGDRKQEEIGGSFARRSREHSYRSCVHLQVPLRSSSSVVFLDKSLLISLEEVDGGRAEKHTFYRSTLSVRLGAPSRSRFPTDYKPAGALEGYRKPGVALLDKSKDSCRSNRGLVGCGLEGPKVERMASTCRVKVRAGDSDSHCNSNALELLSHRRPSPSNADAGGQKGNADEAAFPTLSGFDGSTQPKTASETDSRGRSEHTTSNKTEERQERDRSREPRKILISDASQTLSLKEALELFRPDFISRSQGRMRRLEQRAMKRRALRDSNPDLAQAHRDERHKQKRNCTTPDPLSDNLFKPRERSISGREMQLRSRRIYSKLPEVRKKKEAEKKRAISQTNRLRVEVFKKRLLDQILQR